MTKTLQEERFVYFQECLNSLHTAWAILDSLTDTHANNILVAAAYRMAVIEYAKPFTKTVGKHSDHYLPNYHELDLTNDHKSLHDHLLLLRRKVLAHSDIPILEPKIYRGQLAGQPFPLIIKNRAPTLPDADEVKQLIEVLISQLERHIPEYHQKLYLD